MNAQTGIVNIRGKEYQTVALRVQMFRNDFPDHSLTTAVICRDEDCVVMQATIADPTGRVIANGHSEEYRKSSQINRTSALENAETSAIGRALAAFGLGGTEFASANEVQNAIHQQKAGGAPEGRSQGQGAVSPPEPVDEVAEGPPPRNWGGRYPNKTALRKARVVHHAEIERIGVEGTFDDLDAYLTSPEYQDYIKIASEHHPLWLEGEIPEEMREQLPAEYVQTFALETKARDMIAIRGNVAADVEEPA